MSLKAITPLSYVACRQYNTLERSPRNVYNPTPTEEPIMQGATVELPVAKEKKNDTSIRVDHETADVIGKAARLKDLTIAEYIRASFLPIARKDLMAEAKKLAKGDKPD